MNSARTLLSIHSATTFVDTTSFLRGSSAQGGQLEQKGQVVAPSPKEHRFRSPVGQKCGLCRGDIPRRTGRWGAETLLKVAGMFPQAFSCA